MSLFTSLLLACSMLTRLPLHPRGEVTDKQLRLSVMFYPWVGLLLGALLMLLAPYLQRILAAGVGGVLVVTLLALITGGLHLDGVADWFDAVGGGRGDRARMLDIMKDSRIGAHGATALVLLLLAKCLASQDALYNLDAPLWLAVPTFSRFAIVPLVTWMRPAREQGLARSVHGGSSFSILLGASLPVIALLATLPMFGVALVALVVALVAACVTALLIGLWAQRRLGGATGDVYGAALELSEVVTLLALIQMQSA